MSDRQKQKSDSLVAQTESATIITGGELYHPISQCQDVSVVTRDGMLFLETRSMELVSSSALMRGVVRCSTEHVEQQTQAIALSVGGMLVHHTSIQHMEKVTLGYGYQ